MTSSHTRATGVSGIPSTDPVGGSNKYGAAWKVQDHGKSVTYTIQGSSADIYLMPAADAFAGIKTHWDLTGEYPPPPPKKGLRACPIEAVACVCQRCSL